MFQVMLRGKIGQVDYRKNPRDGVETCVMELIVDEWFEGAAHNVTYLLVWDEYQTKRIRKVSGKIKYLTARCDRLFVRVNDAAYANGATEMWLQAKEFFS